MEDTRTIGDYKIISSINIGEKEIVIGENDKAEKGRRFMCGYMETDSFFEKCTDIQSSDDYISVAELFAARVNNEVLEFKNQIKGMNIPIETITQEDCVPDHYSYDITGKLIVINPEVFKPEFQRADRQLVIVTGGFGAAANSRGSAVFCKNLYSGETTRFNRCDVMGEIKPEKMPQWAKEKMENIKPTKSQQRDMER